MGANTAIEWTDHTFNPWWGCTRVSPGCQNCYAETFAHRFGVEWGKGETRRPATEKVWAAPLTWNKAAQKAGKRARVFCASMADVFDDEGPTGARERLFALIRATPWLDWQLLTKRPENIAGFLPPDWGHGYRNVWLGTTVENQAMADKRIPILLKVPAFVRFLSCEPLIGSVNLDVWLRKSASSAFLSGLTSPDMPEWTRIGSTKIDWVIVGGESGTKARHMRPDWARTIRDQCDAAGVPFLFKQWGEWDADGGLVGKKLAGRMLDGRTWDQFPTLPNPIPLESRAC